MVVVSSEGADTDRPRHECPECETLTVWNGTCNLCGAEVGHQRPTAPEAVLGVPDGPLRDGEQREWSDLGVDVPQEVTPETLHWAAFVSDSIGEVIAALGLDRSDRGVMRVLLTNEGLYEHLDRAEARRRSR